jgi:hypothetical protein
LFGPPRAGGPVQAIFGAKENSGMWNPFSQKKKNWFRQKSLSEIKDITRILVIDDREPMLVEDLTKEGWRVNYIPDLPSYDSTYLIDSHIICLDIMNVGKDLRCESGLGLVKGIKGKHPEKRILLYSSIQNHNIFDESIDLVDKRLYKDGQPYQFIKTVEDLAYEVFDWNKCINQVYQKFKHEFGASVSLTEFEKKLRNSVSSSGEINVEEIAKFTVVGLKIATGMTELIKTVLK